MNSIWQFIIRDWPRKLVAVFFACLIWYTVHLQLQTFETFPEIPVQLALPPELALLDTEDMPRAEVKLRGSERVLSRIESTDIEITVPIPEGAPLGTYGVRLRESHVQLPRGVSVEQIKPESFSVQLDRRVTVSLPVEPNFTGRLDPNLRRETVEIYPQKVEVSGPERLVEQVDVRTEPIELDPAMGMEWEVDVQLQARPGVRFEPSSVKVGVVFKRIRAPAPFHDLRLHVLMDPESPFMLENFDPPPVTAVVSGPSETTDDLTAESVRAFIDLTDITKEGIYRRSVNLWINAPDCEPTWVQPEGYELKVVRRPEE